MGAFCINHGAAEGLDVTIAEHCLEEVTMLFYA
jgi:hypothetical protein